MERVAEALIGKIDDCIMQLVATSENKCVLLKFCSSDNSKFVRAVQCATSYIVTESNCFGILDPGKFSLEIKTDYFIKMISSNGMLLRSITPSVSSSEINHKVANVNKYLMRLRELENDDTDE